MVFKRLHQQQLMNYSHTHCGQDFGGLIGSDCVMKTLNRYVAADTVQYLSGSGGRPADEPWWEVNLPSHRQVHIASCTNLFHCLY